MILLLDNFDSFTFNLVDYFNQLGVNVKVFRNDVSLEEITKHHYSGVVLSPGPEIPEKAGCLLNVVDYYVGKVPMLGICLGHQAIAQYFGAKLYKAIRPMHGKISQICNLSGNIFETLPDEVSVVRYHSLIVKDLPNVLRPLAYSHEQELMAFEHGELPITGLQFHPEAVLTEFGLTMLSNWIRFNNIVD